MTTPTHSSWIKTATPFLTLAILLAVCSCSRQSAEESRSEVTVTKEGPFFLRNERLYIKDNINFFCRPIKRGKNYCFLIMGSVSNPYGGDPPILARFPNGELVNLAEVTTDYLKDVAWSAQDVSGDSCAEVAAAEFIEGDTWPDGTLRIQLNYWLFFVRGDEILSLRASDYGQGELKPAIGNPTTGEIYEFPLTQDQVISVLGAPDTIREYWAE